ncbi:MAG: hypothetical protein K1X44_05135 [Alphaproteobacteria bacterium]|nr:hypothetical protein [Alphaproteobacteria bacterium]
MSSDDSFYNEHNKALADEREKSWYVFTKITFYGIIGIAILLLILKIWLA